MDHVEYRGIKYYIKAKDKRLVLSSIGIENMSEIKGLENLVNLEELYLGGNEITEIKNLNNLINLHSLRLGGNKISEIKGLDALTNLESLRLSGNKISEIKGLETLTNLSSLKLNSNNITEIKGLGNLKNLFNLRLKGNPIREDEFFLLFRSAQEVVKYCQKKIISSFVGEENDYIEHKETFRWDIEKEKKNKNLKSEVSKAACAFLNCKGGKIFIGVDDSGKIKGIQQDLKTYDRNDTTKAKDLLFQDIKNTMKEDLGTTIVNSIDLSFKNVFGKEIVILDIKPSVEPIYHLKKYFRVRNGPASPKLEAKELGDYIYKHFCLDQNIIDQLNQISEDEEIRPPDLKLIEMNISMIENDEIPAENMERTLSSIYSEMIHLHNLEELNEETFRIVRKFSRFAIFVLKQNANLDFQKQILYTLSIITQNLNIKKIVCVECFNYLEALFNAKKYSEELVTVLNNCGFFKKALLSYLLLAIRKDNTFLLRILGGMNFESFRGERFSTIKALNIEIRKIDPKVKREAIEVIKSIITKLENER